MMVARSALDCVGRSAPSVATCRAIIMKRTKTSVSNQILGRAMIASGPRIGYRLGRKAAGRGSRIGRAARAIVMMLPSDPEGLIERTGCRFQASRRAVSMAEWRQVGNGRAPRRRGPARATGCRREKERGSPHEAPRQLGHYQRHHQRRCRLQHNSPARACEPCGASRRGMSAGAGAGTPPRPLTRPPQSSAGPTAPFELTRRRLASVGLAAVTPPPRFLPPSSRHGRSRRPCWPVPASPNWPRRVGGR